MTVRDPNYSKYVDTDRDAVKRGDQNRAVIGPARLEDEEETQQQIDKGIAQASFTSTVLQGNISLGKLTPGYWHTSKYLTGDNKNPTYTSRDSGFLYPFLITETSTIDALAIYVVDGLALLDTASQAMRLGIYNEVDGLPFLLLMETDEFNPADGSIPDNTFHVEEFGAELELKPGRYWLARKRKYNVIEISFGGNARARGRDIHKGTLLIENPIATTIAGGAGGIRIAWNGDGFTSLPAIFDVNDYDSSISGPPSVTDIARPEIYMRAV